MPLRVTEALEWLRAEAPPEGNAGLARYGIVAPNAFGTPMSRIQALAKQLGRNHQLAGALWQTGQYEARLLTAFVAEPEKLTESEMDAWCRDCDNWAVGDTLCFHCFDRTPLAWGRIGAWRTSEEEFVRRNAFALLACVALHAKTAPNASFLRTLAWMEEGAADPRNFVKKAVSWALRSVGRRDPELLAAAEELAVLLRESKIPSCRWVGRDALADFAKLRARRQARGKSSA